MTSPYWVLTTAVPRKEEKYQIAPMGVLAPGSAHARPSARPPIDTSGNSPIEGSNLYLLVSRGLNVVLHCGFLTIKKLLHIFYATFRLA